jgi:hypothetical protein
VAGFQFHEEFLLLQLKCSLLIGGQDRAYSFRNARNRQNATKVRALGNIFEETYHGRFALVVLNIHGLRHRSKLYIGLLQVGETHL